MATRQARDRAAAEASIPLTSRPSWIEDVRRASYEFQPVSAIQAFVSMNPIREWDPRRKMWKLPVQSFLETVTVPNTNVLEA